MFSKPVLCHWAKSLALGISVLMKVFINNNSLVLAMCVYTSFVGTMDLITKYWLVCHFELYFWDTHRHTDFILGEVFTKYQEDLAIYGVYLGIFIFPTFFLYFTYFSMRKSFYFCNKLTVKELSVIRTAVMYHFHTEVFKKYFSHIESTWKYYLWLIMLIISKADKYKDFKTSITLVSLKFINVASALRLKAFYGPPVSTRQKPQVLNMPDKDLWDLFPCLGLELLFFLNILSSGNHKPAVGFRIHHTDSFYSFPQADSTLPVPPLPGLPAKACFH